MFKVTKVESTLAFSTLSTLSEGISQKHERKQFVLDLPLPGEPQSEPQSYSNGYIYIYR